MKPIRSIRFFWCRISSGPLVLLLALALPLGAARAEDYTGTVEFEGQVLFAAPIAGIGAEDLVVELKSAITVRESKALPSLGKVCFKWVRKQLEGRARCNFLLLKSGPEAEERCKDGGPEPALCDPGDPVEAILALSHGVNDQQTDPPASTPVNRDVLNDQLKCQKFFGKAAVNYALRRLKLVEKRCFEGFTEGFDTPDLKDAETLLEERGA